MKVGIEETILSILETCALRKTAIPKTADSAFGASGPSRAMAEGEKQKNCAVRASMLSSQGHAPSCAAAPVSGQQKKL